MGNMTFMRNDGTTKYFYMPEDSWSSGGTLNFMAKVIPDNDINNSAAVINKNFTDSNIINNSDPKYKTGYVGYKMVFVGSDTSAIAFNNNASQNKYKGQFQWTPSSGSPVSFPANNKYIDVIVYADIKVG